MSTNIKPWRTTPEASKISASWDAVALADREIADLRAALAASEESVSQYQQSILELSESVRATQAPSAPPPACKDAFEKQFDLSVSDHLMSYRFFQSGFLAGQRASAPVAPDERAAFEKAARQITHSDASSFEREGDDYADYTQARHWAFWQARAALSVKAGAAAVPDDEEEDGMSIEDLLSAPKLYTQVYCAARIFYDWPNDAALEAAGDAEKQYGADGCKTMPELNSVLAEVLRCDGELAALLHPPPSTLAQQVASAQAEVAEWPDGKLARVKLAGGDQP